MSALESDPESLLGQPESLVLDFKSQPYWTRGNRDRRHRLELAKDVSAMANASGGVIILGISEEKETTSHLAIAKKLSPINSELVDVDGMRKAIAEWVVPRASYTISRHPLKNCDDESALWAVRVFACHPGDMPLLVAKEFTSDRAEEAPRHLFAIYRREDTDNRGFSSDLVHGWIREGYKVARENATSRRLGLDPWETSQLEGDATLAADLAALDLQPEESYLAIQIAPIGGSINNFYEGSPDALFDALARFRGIREGGFGLPEWAEVKKSGAGLRMIRVGSSSLSVMPSGLLTAILAQRPLCWGSPERRARQSPGKPPGPLRIYINPLAISEFSLNTAVAFRQVVSSRLTGQRETRWRTAMGGVEPNENGGELRLPRARIESVLLLGGYADSANSGRDYTGDWSIGGLSDPESSAYRFARQVYGNFHLGPGFIQFADHDSQKISQADIQAL